VSLKPAEDTNSVLDLAAIL